MAPRSERLYRRLLLLLPPALRREAQAELLGTFHAAYARVSGQGPLALMRFWLRMTLDLVIAAAGERWAGRKGGRFRQSIRPLGREIPAAVRRLARTPVWTLASAGTLALGLAASVVGTVLVRDVLLRPLPFPESNQLVRIVEVSENGGHWWPSFPNAADWRDHAGMFRGLGIADIPQMRPVGLEGRAVRASVSRAARGLFETLGVTPAAGRLFTADENRPGGAPVAIASEPFWRREFGGRPLGDLAVTIGQQRFTLVGVLPREFRFLGDGAAWAEPADLWTPMDRDANLGSRTTHGYHVIARLRDGVSLDQARSQMNQLARVLEDQHQEPTQAHSVLLTPLQDVVIRSAREPLQWLLYAAGVVLVVACVNLAAAILAQGLTRSRELSVRLALGATRAALSRTLLAEAVLLAVPGGLLSVLLADGAFHIIRTSTPGTLPRLDEAGLDGSAMGLAFGLAVVTACVAGVVPAVLLSRATVAAQLRTRGATAGREVRRLWGGFVVVQVALTVLLLCFTGLLTRSFMSALAVDLGYDPHHVLTADVSLPDGTYAEPTRSIALYDAVLERLRASPDVAAAGLTSVLPHVTSMYTSGSLREGNDQRSVLAGYRLVDPGYFDAMGIRRLEGRSPLLADGTAAIDRRLQSLLWDGTPAIGDRVLSGFSDVPLTVSGVVGTVREWDQGEETTGAVYVDFHRRPDHLRMMHIVVRDRGDDVAAATTIRRVFAEVDPNVPVSIDQLDVLTAASLSGRRLLLLLAGGFAVTALLLAVAGIYALVAFVVRRQLREAAIRLALGARPASLRRRVLVGGLAPVAAGVAVGLAGALPAGRAMRAQLFNVHPADPVVLIVVALAVIAAAIGAGWVPAHRMARVDPADALRAE